MIDARIIVDELEIQCSYTLTDAMAARVAREIADALGEELQRVQQARAQEFGTGESTPCVIGIRRASVRLEDPSISPRAIAKSLASEITRGLRRHV